MFDRVLYGDVVAEAHLAFRGMDVDVHLGRREVDEEEERGLCVALVARVCLADGVGDRRGGRGASVDEDVLLAPCWSGEVRALDVACDADGLGARVWGLKREELFGEVRSEYVEQPVGESRRRREAVDLASVDD